MTDLDRETSAAVDALAHRIRNRDAAILRGSDCEEIGDAEVFALEFLAALRGHGWRPTPARVYPVPQARAERSSSSLPDEYLKIRAEWEAGEHPNTSRDTAARDGAA